MRTIEGGKSVEIRDSSRILSSAPFSGEHVHVVR